MKLMSNNKAYSLIEVMIALVIFSFLMLGTSSMIVATIRSNQTSQETTTAYYETQRVIETLKEQVNMSPILADQLVSDGEQVEYVYNDNGEVTYTIRYLMENPTSSGEDVYSDQIKQLTVTAEWNVGSSTRSITTRTLILLP